MLRILILVTDSIAGCLHWSFSFVTILKKHFMLHRIPRYWVVIFSLFSLLSHLLSSPLIVVVPLVSSSRHESKWVKRETAKNLLRMKEKANNSESDLASRIHPSPYSHTKRDRRTDAKRCRLSGRSSPLRLQKETIRRNKLLRRRRNKVSWSLRLLRLPFDRNWREKREERMKSHVRRQQHVFTA